MKPYLVTTGSLFGLLAAVHVAQVIGEWPGVLKSIAADAEAGVGLIAAALAIWAWRLLRSAGGGAGVK